MSCGPGIVNIPHLGCCGSNWTNISSIRLTSRKLGFCSRFLPLLEPLQSNFANLDAARYPRARFNVLLPGGHRKEQVVDTGNGYGVPSIENVSESSGFATFALGHVAGIVALQTLFSDTSAIYTVRVSFPDGVFVGNGTLTIGFEGAPEPLSVHLGEVYSQLANQAELQTFPTFPVLNYPEAATIGVEALWEAVTAASVRAYSIPVHFAQPSAFITYWMERPFTAPYPRIMEPLRGGLGDAPRQASFNCAATKMRLPVSSAKLWMVRHTGGVDQGTYPMPPATEEISCASGSLPGGLLNPPPRELVRVGYGYAQGQIVSNYAFPPLRWPRGIVPSCAPEVAV